MSTNIKIKNTSERFKKKKKKYKWKHLPNINLQEVTEWNTPFLHVALGFGPKCKDKTWLFRFLSLSTFNALNHSTY